MILSENRPRHKWNYSGEINFYHFAFVISSFSCRLLCTLARVKCKNRRCRYANGNVNSKNEKFFEREEKNTFTVFNFDGEMLCTNSSLINPKFMLELMNKQASAILASGQFETIWYFCGKEAYAIVSGLHGIKTSDTPLNVFSLVRRFFKFASAKALDCKKSLIKSIAWEDF